MSVHTLCTAVTNGYGCSFDASGCERHLQLLLISGFGGAVHVILASKAPSAVVGSDTPAPPATL